MWVQRVWPFSVLHRIERKIDLMSDQSQKLKLALDHIGAAFAGIQASIASISANLAAALANQAQPDPLLDAAAQEAQDLDAKMTDFAASLQSDHGIAIPETPRPAPVDQAPVDQPQPVGGTGGGAPIDSQADGGANTSDAQGGESTTGTETGGTGEQS